MTRFVYGGVIKGIYVKLDIILKGWDRINLYRRSPSFKILSANLNVLWRNETFLKVDGSCTRKICRRVLYPPSCGGTLHFPAMSIATVESRVSKFPYSWFSESRRLRDEMSLKNQNSQSRSRTCLVEILTKALQSLDYTPEHL